MFAHLSVRPRSLLSLLATYAALSAAQADSADAVAPRIAIEAKSGTIIGIGLVPNERLLATAHSDGKIYWTTDEGKQASEAWTIGNGAISAFAMSRDGALVAVSHNGPVVEVIERKSRKTLLTARAFNRVTQIYFSSDNKSICTYSQLVQVFTIADGRLSTLGVVTPDRDAFGFLINNTAIGQYNRATGWIDGMMAPGNQKPTVSHFQVTPDKIKLYDVTMTADGRLAIAAAEGGLLIPVTQFKEKVREYTAIPRITGEFRVLPSKDGRFAICLELISPGTSARGVIWDVVQDKLVAEITGLPKELGVVGFSPIDGLLAVSDTPGRVKIWNIGPLLKSESPPDEFLNSRVTFQVLSDRVSDPAAPVKHRDWDLSRWTHEKAPPYMKGAWKLSPNQPDANVSLVQIQEDGAFFYVSPVATAASGEDRLSAIFKRTFMTSIDNWIELGPCPWKPDSTLFCTPRRKGSAQLYGMSRLDKDSEMYFVPGRAYAADSHQKAFPPGVQFAFTTSQVAEWLHEHQFEQIDKLANESRRTKAKYGWGTPVLGAVYAGLKCPTNYSEQRHATNLEAYVTKSRSTTAHMAYASHLIDLGWNSRGSDIAANVPRKAQAEFVNYLRAARKILDQLAPRATDDPYLDALYLRVSPAHEFNATVVSNLIIQGLKKHPDSLATIGVGSMFLLERWTGDPKAASRLAERLKTEFPQDSGRAAAALIALNIYSIEPDRWGNDLGFVYEEFSKDYQALKRLYSVNGLWRLDACELEILHSSQADVKTVWRQLGNSVDLGGLRRFARFAEWNDRIEATPRPALLWSVLGSGYGKISFSADGERTIVSSSGSGLTRTLRTSDGSVTSSFRGPFIGSLAVAQLDADHTVIASTGGICHLNDGHVQQQFRYPRPLSILLAKLSQNGTRLVLLTESGSLIFFDTLNGKILSEVQEIVRDANARRVAIAVSPDGSRAAVATSADRVQIFDVQKGLAVSALTSEEDSVWALCFINDGSKLAAAGTKTVWEWDLQHLTRTWSFSSPSINPVSLEVTQDGQHWALHSGFSGASADAEISILHRKPEGERWQSLPEIRSFADLAWHPARPFLAVYSWSGIVSLWDTERIESAAPPN